MPNELELDSNSLGIAFGVWHQGKNQFIDNDHELKKYLDIKFEQNTNSNNVNIDTKSCNINNF